MPEKLSLETLDAILGALPAHLNFIDDTDTIRYRSKGEYQIFEPKPGVIGRKVQECHPEAVVPLVNRVIRDLRSGKRKIVEFWKDRKGRKIYYRYLPVKDRTGRYIGTLEVVEDITDIQKITGEKKGLDAE